MKTVGEKSSVSSNLTVSAKILKRSVVIGKPKFDYNDEVFFEIDGKKIIGNIYIIDAYGTFFDPSDVSYDIITGEGDDKILYKHISEKRVTKK